MSRWLVLNAACAALLCVGCGPAAPNHPNLLLIVVDTLRADHLEPYGYSAAETPRIAALAREGARFENAYAPTATTGPTHAGLFTGQHPRSVGVLRNAVPLAPEHTTLAERLAEAGWETAAVVSSFPLHRGFGFDQGFSTYIDDFDPKRASVRHTEFEGFAVPEGFDRRADETTDRALEWLGRRHANGQPFFLFVHYFDPHEPYVAPRAYQERFRVGPDANMRERAAALYDAEVAFTDTELGRLLDGFEALGLTEDTLVVLTSDHGEGLFDHGHLFHDVHLYEEAVRVPLLVRGAGIPAGRALSGPVSLLDLLPTLLDLLGTSAPIAALPGQSLAAALHGDAVLPADRSLTLERRVFSAERVGTIPVQGEELALVSDGWKYIEAPEVPRRELYDLENDPSERTNAALQEPMRAARMAAELARWRARTPLADSAGTVSPADRARLEALGYID